MLVIILCVIICIVVFETTLCGYYDDPIEIVFAGIFSIIWCAVLIGITVGISTLCANIFNTPYTLAQSEHLYSLSNYTGASGSFFLGSGYIDSKMTYFYVTKNTYGYKINHVSSDDNIYLKQDATPQTSRIDSYDRINHKLLWWLGYLPLSERTIIHIPKNTIKMQFEVNA